jgi:hypothetical protein
MQVGDIIRRVAAKCDDQEQTYLTSDYIMGFMQDTMEWIFGKLRLTASEFDEQIVVLPGVNAGLPNLDSYQADGQPLAMLVQPRMIRWKLAGQPITNWCRGDGPLDFVRDIQNGIAALDSWAWIKYSIKLSNYSVSLDLEVSGDFLFDPLVDEQSQIQISIAANRAFSCQIAAEVGKARGNDKWVTTYSADALDALEDLSIAMTQAEQAKTRRVGRMNRRGGGRQVMSTNSGQLI